ncbi:endoplasmic reticulum membrane-associated RNA degradation protein-like, partial [Condylostylus longicornis]|uniref:endoplasmic reticulum membrane-associated RNA degradation protein-like n=1 Tax=Condylostylus longicornis TaxID=2530218 RepID=UPI00244DDC32
MDLRVKSDKFSLISQEVHELLSDKSLKENESALHLEEFFKENLFNWKNIEKYLIANHININIDNFSYDYCLQCSKLLHPIWKQCQTNYNRTSLLQRFNECVIWKSDGCNILDIIDLESDTRVFEGLLLLTSILENAMGNVYFTLTQKIPPHLLKDLLKTSEINEYFGSFPIYFLQLILGTPNSINLRNILWHGFPGPKEIPEYFFETILVTMISLSEIYKEKPIKIIHRTKIKNIEKYFNYISDIQISNLDNEIKDKNSFFECIESSKYCPKPHEIYWKTLYKYYLENNYKKFIILLLPQIELTFRLIYFELNDYDVSAKINEYYITMDSIFEHKVPNTSIENKLYTEKFNENILKLAYDLFISPNGPRIRDKISHGEIDLNYIDKNSSVVILTFGLLLLGNHNKIFENFIENYEICFHINAIFKNNFKNTVDYFVKLKEFQNHPYLTKYFTCNNEITQCTNKLIGNFNLKIFKRHSNEKIIIGFLNRTIQCIQIVCKNLLESYEIKFKLLNDKQLRSRERKTVQNMIEIYPNIQFSLSTMIESIAAIFFKLHNDENFGWIENYFHTINKFLKFFLKAVENFIQTSSISKNNINKSNSICHSFNEHLIKFKEE